MKKSTLLFFFLCFSASLLAQDIIITKENERIEVKVLMEYDAVIKYSLFNTLTDSTYLIPKAKIYTITYENGKVVSYEDFKVVSASSQNDSATIKIQRKGFGTVFSQNGKRVKFEELMAITKTNAEAYKYILRSNSLDVAGMFFSAIGGLCLGFPIGYGIGSLLSGNKVSMKIFLPILGIGIGLSVCGIVFNAMSADNARRGVEIYNNALKQRHNTSGNSLDIGFSTNGVAMKLNF